MSGLGSTLTPIFDALGNVLAWTNPVTLPTMIGNAAGELMMPVTDAVGNQVGTLVNSTTQAAVAQINATGAAVTPAFNAAGQAVGTIIHDGVQAASAIGTGITTALTTVQYVMIGGAALVGAIILFKLLSDD